MVRNPPINGPSATAAPAVAPQTANAVARSWPWNVDERMPSVAGIISDAPMPSMIASPKISTGTDWASDASSEPTPNSAAPMMNIRRAPKRSASRPPMISRLANVSE